MHLRRLLAEIRRGVFFLGAHLGLGFHAQVVVERIPVTRVGPEPQRARDRLAVVAQRQRHAVHCRAAVLAVRVIELGTAHAHLHVGHALPRTAAHGQRAELCTDAQRAGVVHRVADEIRRRLFIITRRCGLAERREGAMQLGIHGIQEHRRVCRRVSRSRLLGTGRARQRHQDHHGNCGCEDGESDRPALRAA